MPGQSLLKATLLKETYVPLAELNGADKNQGVVRILPKRLSLLERRFLDLIAPKVFPARHQFSELRQAARLQRAGFQVQDVIEFYESLVAAKAATSKGCTTLTTVDENCVHSPVKLQPLDDMPNDDADDGDFGRSAQPAVPTSPDHTLSTYRNAIFDTVMFELEEKWRESNWAETEQTSGFQNGENLSEREPGRTSLTAGGWDGCRSEEVLGFLSSSRSSKASDRDGIQSPHCEDYERNVSLKISFEIPVARKSPEEDMIAAMTASSRGCYLHSDSTSSSRAESTGSTATSRQSMPPTESPAIGSLDSKMVGTVHNNGGNVNDVRMQSGESFNGESLYDDTIRSPSQDDSSNSLEILRNGDSDARITPNGRLYPQNFASQINSMIDEDDEVNGERSFMTILKSTSTEVDHAVSNTEQRGGSYTDGRDQHFTDVDQSGSVRARVEARQLSPSRLSEASQNLSSKFNGDRHQDSIERSSKTFWKSRSVKESIARVFPDAKDQSHGRKAGLSDSVENLSVNFHGDTQHRPSIGGSSSTHLESLSMKDFSEGFPEASQDCSSRGAGVATSTRNSPARCHGDSQHRSPGGTPTFLQSLTMKDNTVIAEAKQEFSSRKGEGPERVSTSSKIHGGKFLNVMEKSKSIKERATHPAVKEDVSATSPADSHGLERAAKPSLASQTMEKTQVMREGTTRLQPIVDSAPSETQLSHEVRVETCPTHPLDEPLRDINNNNSSFSASLSLTQVVLGPDTEIAINRSPKRPRPKLGALFEEARDSETEKLVVKSCTSCTTVGATVKRILGSRKDMFSMKLVSAWFNRVDWSNVSAKVEAPTTKQETPRNETPRRSFPAQGATQSSPKSVMASPNRSDDRGICIRKPIKVVVGSNSSEVKQMRSPNRAISNEGRPMEASTNKIHPVGCVLEARSSEASTATAAIMEGSTDIIYAGGRNLTGKELVHPVLGHRQLRSRSTSSRFRREYIAKQEGMEVQSETVVA